MRADGAEPRVLALAGRQHGTISWAQLEAAGVSARWVEHRVARGWLRRLHRGVYLVGAVEAPHTAAMAAFLACGAGALVAHYAGAVLWDWRPARDDAIDVIVPGRKTRPRDGIRTHRAAIHPNDITRRHGVPVTSAARTLLDLAATEPTAELDRALNEAMLQRHASPHSLNEQFSRYPHHRGSAALRGRIEREPELTRSEAERRMLDLIRRAGLPQPEVNARIASYEVDLLWRAANLVVEVDGYAFHSMRRSFERDRRRDQTLLAGGWRVLRVTWRQIQEAPEAVVATLATVLAA